MWITAIATLALGVFAVVTASLALLAGRVQVIEIRALREGSEQGAEDRRRAQAVQVFWRSFRQWLSARNRSSSPEPRTLRPCPSCRPR